MNAIKIFIIPWIPWLVLLLQNVQIINAGLCQQQAKSAFKFHVFGNTNSKKECNKRCCQKKNCRLSIIASGKCFGIQCTNGDLCKLIIEQLVNFEGHRVDKRSIDDDESTSIVSNSTLSLIDQIVNKRSSDEDDSDDASDNDDDNDDYSDGDGDDDNNQPALQCTAGNYHKSVIPKRKKGFKFKKLHGRNKSLLDCSHKCCNTDNCVLGFSIDRFCYGVMCSGEKNCHSKKDRLPHTKIHISSIRKGVMKKSKPPPTRRQHHRHHHMESEGNEVTADRLLHKYGDDINGNDQREMDEMQHDIMIHQHQNRDGGNELRDDIQQLNFRKQNSGQINDEEMQHSSRNNNYDELQFRNRNDNYESIGPTMSEILRNHVPILTMDNSNQIEGLQNQNNHKEMGETLESNENPLLKNKEEYFHIPTTIHASGSIGQLNNDSKVKEDLILQKIENLEHKIESKGSALTPTEKNTIKVLKKLEKVESKNFIEMQPLDLKVQNNKTDVKNKTSGTKKKKNTFETQKDADYSGSGSGEEEEEENVSGKKAVLEKKNRNLHSKHADKTKPEGSNKKKKVTKKKVVTKTHTEKVKKDEIAHRKDKLVKKKQKQRKHEKNEHHKIEDEHEHDTFSGNHKTRDEITKPEKKTLLEKLKSHYGHKEDIFKEFEKFREMYESSGESDHHTGHKKENTGKLEATEEISGDEESGNDSQEIKPAKKLQPRIKPPKVTKTKAHKHKSPPTTKHVTTQRPSTTQVPSTTQTPTTLPTTTKLIKHTTVAQSPKKATRLPTATRHHTKPLPTDSDSSSLLSPTKLKIKAKLTKNHMNRENIRRTTKRPTNGRKPVTQHKLMKPTKPKKASKRPLKPTKQPAKLMHPPTKHMKPTTKATVPTVHVDGLKKNQTKKKEKIKQEVMDKKQNKLKNFKPSHVLMEKNIKDLTQLHKHIDKKINKKVPSLNIAVGDEESADSEPLKNKKIKKPQPRIKLNRKPNNVHPSKAPQLHVAVSQNEPQTKLVPTVNKSPFNMKKPNNIVNNNQVTKLNRPTKKPTMPTKRKTQTKAAVTTIRYHTTRKASLATKKIQVFTPHPTQKIPTMPLKMQPVSIAPSTPMKPTVPTIVMSKTTTDTQTFKGATMFPMGQYDKLKQQISIHHATPNVFPPPVIQKVSPQSLNPVVNQYGDLFGNTGKMPMLNDDGMPEDIGQTKMDNFTSNPSLKQLPVKNIDVYTYPAVNPTEPMTTRRIATYSAFKFPTVNSLLKPPEMFHPTKGIITPGAIHALSYLKSTPLPVKTLKVSPAPQPKSSQRKQGFSPPVGNTNTLILPGIPEKQLEKPNALRNGSMKGNQHGIHIVNRFEKPLLMHNPEVPLREPQKLNGIVISKPKQNNLLTKPTPKTDPREKGKIQEKLQQGKFKTMGIHELKPTKKMKELNQKKETPQETVNRILGHKAGLAENKQNQKVNAGHKVNDQGNKEIPKNDNELDNFFKNTDVTVSPPGKQIGHIHLENITLQSNKKNKMNGERLKNLENFFKKADINHAKNVSDTHVSLTPSHKPSVNEIHDSPKKTGPKNTTGGHGIGTVENVPSGLKPHKDIIKIDQGFLNQHKHENDEIKSVKGCNTIGDFRNRIFKSENVGYIYKMPKPLTIKQCVDHCCQHENCQVAFLEGQVCNLVECKNQTLCKTLVPTNRNTRLVYFHKSRKQQADSVGSFCQQQLATGIPWVKTKAGTAAIRNCPREAIGSAKRHCDNHAKWLQPDFSDCVSTPYAKLEKKVKGLGYSVSSKSLIEEMDDMTTQTIDNSLIFGGDIVKVTNVLLGLANFLTKSRTEKIEHKDLRSVTRVVSNLLDDTNQQEWSHIKQAGNGPNKLMNLLDTISLYSAAQLPRPMNMKPVITHSILLSVSKIGRTGSKYIFPNYSVPLSNEWTIRKDSIIIPHTVFDNEKPASVASMSFKTLGYILPHRWNTKKRVTFTDGFVINSNVISSAVQPKPRGPINPPVTIILHHLKEGAGDAKCVFWDFKAGGDSSWSTEGCRVVSSNRTTTICQCNHLTHFAVLSNTNDQKVSSKEQVREHTMAAVWLGIPLTVVLLIGALYTCFAWSKAPRRRHVVLMDKKPVLPEDDIIVTKTVSEKYPGSPDRYLYAANSTPSPSELEWEHAWDFLTNSDFDMFRKKPMQDQFCKQLLKHKKLLEERKRLKPAMTSDNEHETPACNDASSGDSGASGDSCNSSTTTFDSQGLYFQWKHQDDSEWSKDRIKCLGKGLLDVSNEHAQPPVRPSTESGNTAATDDQALHETVCHLDTFSPLGMSSPHSISFDELTYNPSSIQNTRNYLQISFDPDVDGHLSSDISSNYDSINQSNIDSNFKLNDFDKDENADSGLELNSSSDLNSNDNESPENETNTFAKEPYVHETKIPNDPFEDCAMLIGIYDDAYKTTLFDLVEVDILSPRVPHYLCTEPIMERPRTTPPPSETGIDDEHILAPSAFSSNNYTNICTDECCDLGLNWFFDESVSVDFNYFREEEQQSNRNISPLYDQQSNRNISPLYDSINSPVMQVMAEFIQPVSNEHAHDEHVAFMELFACPAVQIQHVVNEQKEASQINDVEREASQINDVEESNTLSPDANSSYSPLFTSTPLSPRSPSLSWSKSPPLSRSASKSPVLSRAPSLCKIPERTPSFKLKPTSTPPQVSKRVPPSLMSKTTVLPSGCRVLRTTAKENKQTTTHGSTVRPQTPHMKSYIALRQQCRRNDSQVMRDHSNRTRISRRSSIRKRRYNHDGDTSPKSPLTSPKIERQNKKTENGECCVKEVSFNPITHANIILSDDRGLKRGGLHAKSCSSFKCKDRVMKNSRRFRQMKNCSFETFDRVKMDLPVKKVERRTSMKENKFSIEKRTFSGHLRKWQREDHVNLI